MLAVFALDAARLGTPACAAEATARAGATVVQPATVTTSRGDARPSAQAGSITAATLIVTGAAYSIARSHTGRISIITVEFN